MEIKLCPFCGKKPESYLTMETIKRNECIVAGIECAACGVAIKHNIDNYPSFAEIKTLIDETIKHWNSRINCPECIKED